MIRYRIVLPTDDHKPPLGGLLGLQFVFASQERDWTSFLPRLRGVELGEDNPVVWFGRDWQRLNTTNELNLHCKDGAVLMRNPFGPSRAHNAGG